MGTLRREETLSLSCACLKNYPRIIKKRSWINQKEEGESYPKTINFPARSLCPPPPSSPSCTQEGRSILERGVQNSPNLSPTVIKTHHVPLREVKFTKRGAHFPSDIPLPLPLHTHSHTRMHQTSDTPLRGSQIYIKGYICYHPAHDSRGLILEQEQVCKETVVLRRWEI